MRIFSAAPGLYQSRKSFQIPLKSILNGRNFISLCKVITLTPGCPGGRYLVSAGFQSRDSHHSRLPYLCQRTDSLILDLRDEKNIQNAGKKLQISPEFQRPKQVPFSEQEPGYFIEPLRDILDPFKTVGANQNSSIIKL